MENKKIAVLDLGTNSFHLLIAKVEESRFLTVFKDKKYIKLASEGIEAIPQHKIDLALKVLTEYKKILDMHNIDCVKINATEGLRRACNAAVLINRVKEDLLLDIQIIDGEREATLIHKGVSKAVLLNDANALIIDIGGGSTEFIIANAVGVKWQTSLPLGAAVLKNKFGSIDPLTQVQYKLLVEHISKALQPLRKVLEIHQVETIIGASGTFDTLVNMLRAKDGIHPYIQQPDEIINLSGFKVIHLACLRNNLEERMAMPGMEQERAEMMPFATTLISVVLSMVKPKRSMVASAYALKEGLLLETKEEMEAV